MNQRNSSRLPGNHRPNTLVHAVVLTGLGQLALLAGCDRAEIHSYRVARESDLRSAPVVEQQPAQRQSLEVTWSVPEDWTEVETTSSMRIATFRASNTQEIAITAFPGDVGGLIANVNRWRGQIGLDSTDEAGVIEDIVRLDGVNVIIVDLAGTSARLLGSIIDVGDGKTWFAKTTGPADLVEQVKDDLIAFSASLHIHDHADGHNHDQHTDQADMGSATDGGTDEVSSAATPNTDTTAWEPPADWNPEENASSILKAAYLSQSGARITLTSLSGNGGGQLGNINRWRGQLGLPIVQSLDELPIKGLDNGGVLVDFQAPDDSSRMAAGIVPAGSQTLFFKLTGTVEAVGTELPRFEEFINAFTPGNTGAP